MSGSDLAEGEPGAPVPIVRELSFSFRWENLEAVVEWLEALPDKGTVFITIDTERIKEAVIDGFEYVFSETLLTHMALINGD